MVLNQIQLSIAPFNVLDINQKYVVTVFLTLMDTVVMFMEVIFVMFIAALVHHVVNTLVGGVGDQNNHFKLRQRNLNDKKLSAII